MTKPPIKITGQAPDKMGDTAIKTPDKGTRSWRVPEETPVAFVYNRRNYAVMLATPDDLADFAVGFSLTERIVERVDDILEIDIHCSEVGIDLRIKISPERLELLDIRQQRRNLVGGTGCGVCGLENADVFFESLPRVSDEKASVSSAALVRSLHEFGKFQPLNQRTRSVHAAAWARADGAIQCAREDVGRHNALDKLLGALARENENMSTGYVLMSSRCSYEVVEKAARRGVRAVACVSAPTAFAIRKAQEANIVLYCRDGDSFVEVLP